MKVKIAAAAFLMAGSAFAGEFLIDPSLSDSENTANFSQALSRSLAAGAPLVFAYSVLDPAKSAGKAGDTDPYPAGDVFFLQGLPEADEQMRAEDYRNLYPTLKRLNDLRFRVIINLFADIRDLSRALSSRRPAVIIWSSHGEPRGLLDKEEQVLPFDIFKHTSDKVYQFIIATCYGSLAIKNYDLSKARHVKFTGWDFPLSTGYFRDFLAKWDILENYPAGRAYNGLRCAGASQDFQLVRDGDSRVVSRFGTRAACLRFLYSSASGVACSNLDRKRLSLYDVAAGKEIGRSYYLDERWCMEAPSRIRGNRLCYLDGEDYHYKVYDLTAHAALKNPQFSQQEECYAFLR